jgi:hypothetical protein
VLFSDEVIARVINDRFEPVWVSVRDVPTVTIDFGKGHKLTRTLHGNVATYVLTADGTIIDVLPGLYESHQYLSQLNQLWWVHHYAVKTPEPAVFLADYHNEQSKAIKTSGKAKVVKPFADMSKMSIEISTKTILRSPVNLKAAGATSAATAPEMIERPDFSKPHQLKHWRKIYEDTDVNEHQRRGQIHRILANRPNAKPDDVTKEIYRDVLHADIDDPYLGLQETLFRDYPFQEDRPPTPDKISQKHG